MQEDAGIKFLKIETEIADDDKTKVSSFRDSFKNFYLPRNWSGI